MNCCPNTSTVEMGETLHTPTTARFFTSFSLKLYRRVEKRKPLLKKAQIKSWLDLTQRHVGDSRVKWKKVLWSDETIMELFGLQTRRYVWWTPKTAHHHKYTVRTNMVVTQSCWGDASQQLALISLWWERIKLIQKNIGKSWRKNWFSVHENYDLGENVFSSKTATRSIQQELHRHCLTINLCMFYSGQVCVSIINSEKN